MGKPLQPSPALTPNSLIKNSTEDRERDNSSRDSSREREREMRQHFMTSPQQQMFAQHHMEQLKKQQQQAQSQNIPQPPQSPHSVVLQHQAAAQAQAHAQQQVNAALRNLGHHVAPSVYEMAALTQDLDTQVITTKIKEALLANNIGQKVSDFADCFVFSNLKHFQQIMSSFAHVFNFYRLFFFIFYRKN